MKFDRSHLKSSASLVLASIFLLSGMTMTVMGQTEAGSGSQEAKSSSEKPSMRWLTVWKKGTLAR